MIHNFTAFDYILMVLLVLSALIGFSRGLLKEVISCITWVTGFILALNFSPRLAQAIFQNETQHTVYYMIPFILILLAACLAGFFVSKFLKVILYSTGLGIFDKGFGLVFGMIRGSFFVLLLLLMINITSYNQSQWYQGARFLAWFDQPVAWSSKYFPSEYKNITTWVSFDQPDLSLSIDHLLEG